MVRDLAELMAISGIRKTKWAFRDRFLIGGRPKGEALT
jgi:hypothetical protein